MRLGSALKHKKFQLMSFASMHNDSHSVECCLKLSNKKETKLLYLCEAMRLMEHFPMRGLTLSTAIVLKLASSAAEPWT